VEPFWNRRRIARVLFVFGLPTLVAGLLGGLFWAGAIGFFAAAALVVIWLTKDDSEELHRGEFATDRNRRLHSMRFPFRD
jgi:membrane protein implicated in regulation of membrane protease activity